MRPTEPLPIHHSWPLLQADARLDLGLVWDGAPVPAIVAATGDHATGAWTCDLATNALRWSAAVYDLFGLARDARPSRAETVALYREESRATLERLRAYAIRHRRGFTLDAELRPANGGTRWMRLIAAPVCTDDGRVVGLYGLKRDISAAYR